MTLNNDEYRKECLALDGMPDKLADLKEKTLKLNISRGIIKKYDIFYVILNNRLMYLKCIVMQNWLTYSSSN